MELIVILLGEFLLFPVFAAIGALINLAAGFLGFLVELILCATPSAGKKKNHVSAPTVVSSKKTFPIKIVTRTAGALFILTLVFLLAVNTVLFEPTARFIVSKLEEKTKIEISFSSVSGGVFSGAIKLKNLHVKRENHGKLDFDILAQSAHLNIDVFSLLFDPITIETLALDGVSGAIWDKAKQKDRAPEKPDETGRYGVAQKNKNKSENDFPRKNLEAKKAFVINDLAINDVDLKLRKSDKEPLNLVLDKIHSAPFRSNYAVFDTFFRSNIEGRLNNHKVAISTHEIEDGRKTKWQLDDFPVSLIKNYVPKAPFSWFTSGNIDILVEDEWQYGESAEIEMDWSLQLKGVVVDAPENTSLISKAIAYPIVNYINGREDDVDFRFSFLMKEKQFESTSSLDAAGLWDSVINALSKKTAEMTGKKKEGIRQGFESGIQGFKNFLDKKRNSE